MQQIVPLSDPAAKDHTVSGGKGASLATLISGEFSVPEGAVVTTSNFNELWKEDELQAVLQDPLDAPEFYAAAESAFYGALNSYCNSSSAANLKAELVAAFPSGRFAVRSSATVEDSPVNSWAGQFETILNVPAEEIFSSVQHCWASAISPRVVSYAEATATPLSKLSLAVVVQRMIDCDTAGVAFSVHPATKNYDHILIEAVFGLGEGLVSGKINPDTFVVNKHTKELVLSKVAHKSRKLYRDSSGNNVWKYLLRSEASQQTLNETQVGQIAAISNAIERQYSGAVDIEWGFAENKLYLFQSRPITTL